MATTQRPTGTAQHQPPEREHLRGRLGVPHLVFTVLAYNAPLAVYAGFLPVVIAFGNGQGAPTTFVAVGALLLIFSVGLNAMSRHMKSPGAFYSYISAGLGRPVGLAGAFTAFLSYVLITIGAYAYGGIVAKALVENLLHGPELPWWLWCLVFWAVVSVLSMLQIDVSAKVLGISITLEVAIVLAWSLAVVVRGGPGSHPLDSFTPTAATSGSVPFAIIFGVLCITGFEALAVFREETKDPVRTVPRATYASVALLATLYTVGSLVWLKAFGVDGAIDAGGTDPSGSFTGSVKTYLGSVFADLVSVLLVTSVFACLLALHNIASRYVYTLGEDRVIPAALGKVHPRFGSPANAALTVAAIMLVGFAGSAVLGIDPLTVYARAQAVGAVGIIMLMAATALAVVVFFRRHRELDVNLWQSLMSPVLALAGLATAWYLAVSNMDAVAGSSKGEATLFLVLGAVVILAAVGLALVLRRLRPEVYRRIGKQDV
ncbi:APC family permease [Nocardioides acrostichi]|uniref:APC family permease n=1 Tax=Nocardioides acrostichi TaxID=2784339 RepID=A0A930UV39_9ACTN|nr:APC family permease [Nocardioides acrostichi]MBF4160736.1 APC family permease [Nocardioides acrostichi]